jgi:hypothetical protein
MQPLILSIFRNSSPIFRPHAVKQGMRDTLASANHQPWNLAVANVLLAACQTAGIKS